MGFLISNFLTTSSPLKKKQKKLQRPFRKRMNVSIHETGLWFSVCETLQLARKNPESENENPDVTLVIVTGFIATFFMCEMHPCIALFIGSVG